jgi:hypothetical protein
LHFETNDNFETKDIVEFYKTFEPDIKNTTIHWRIYSLIQNGIIRRIGRGKYTLKNKPNYLPEIPKKLKAINSILKKNFPFSTYCLWSSFFLNEFTIHQSIKSFFLIEVEKDSVESIFHFLKDRKYKVFIEPSREVFDNYALGESNFIIVKSLISEAPLQKIKNLSTVTLEKLLVDIFCDDIIFSAYQGNEMKTIFSEAYKKYSINENKLFRYTDRRGKKEQMKKYLKLINGN